MKNGDKDTPRRGFLADDQAVNPFYPFFTIPLKIATLLLRFFLNYTIYKWFTYSPQILENVTKVNNYV